MAAWAAGAALSRRVGYWTGLGSVAGGLGLIALVADRSLREQLYRRGCTMVGYGVAVGLFMAVAAWALFPAVVRSIPRLARDSANLYAAFAAVPPARAALLLPFVVTGEELVWRGVIHGALTTRFRSSAAVALGAAVYAAASLPAGSLLLALTAFACGLLWSLLRVATAGLVAAVVSHLVWAELVLLVHPIATR